MARKLINPMTGFDVSYVENGLIVRHYYKSGDSVTRVYKTTKQLLKAMVRKKKI